MCVYHYLVTVKINVWNRRGEGGLGLKSAFNLSGPTGDVCRSMRVYIVAAVSQFGCV